MSQLQVRKGSHGMATAPSRGDAAATGLSDYITAANIAYNGNARIPVIKMQDNAHLRYRPGQNQFDVGDEQMIQKFDDRDKLIRDLDTGMSPFMKN